MKTYNITDEQLRDVGFGRCYLKRQENKDNDPQIEEINELEEKVIQKIKDGTIRK